MRFVTCQTVECYNATDIVKKATAAVVLHPIYPAITTKAAGTHNPRPLLTLRMTTVEANFFCRIQSVR